MRGKASVAIDLKDPENLARLKSMISRADILIENFKVGGLTKFGLDFDSLHAAHPALVYYLVTGFGQDRPYASRAGYDFLVQGMFSIQSLTGEREGQSQKMSGAFADIFSGLYSVIDIQAALAARMRSGLDHIWISHCSTK